MTLGPDNRVDHYLAVASPESGSAPVGYHRNEFFENIAQSFDRSLCSGLPLILADSVASSDEKHASLRKPVLWADVYGRLKGAFDVPSGAPDDGWNERSEGDLKRLFSGEGDQ